MTSKTTINGPLEYSLRLFGAWPDSSYVILKTILWIILMLTFIVFQCWYCITHITSSLIDLLDGFSYTLSNSLVFFKMIIIWLHKRTFYEILTTMFEDRNNYDLTIEDRRIMTDKVVLSSRISNFLIGYFVVTFLSYAGLAPVLDTSQVSSDVKPRKFLLNMEFPFEATISPRYEVILAIQFTFELLIVYLAATSIALIAALVLHVGSQIDVFCRKLAEASTRCKKGETEKIIIKEIVTRHQRIIQLSKNIEKIFRYIALYQFVSNMLVICFVSFILVVSLHTEQATIIIMKCFPYYVAINCEAFILCYTGEYLISKSETITKSMYCFLWYQLKPAEIRCVLLIILRSQKQLTLSAGKFVSLSLEAFANMLKGSLSYVSVLYAMY